MDSISTARLQLIYPPLADKITRVLVELEAEGIEARVTQGLRTWAEQDALYAQGRTAPGEIVTNCPGGKSYHNFGLAADIVPSVYGPDQPYNPDWHSQHPTWKRMEALAVSYGLTIGAAWRSFPDAPHVQLTGRFPEGAPDDEVIQLYKNGGTQAVWDAVTQSL